MPKSNFLNHVYCVGLSGMGKTTLVLSIIAQLMMQEEGIIVIDPHGDLITDILTVARMIGREDITVLDLMDEEHPFGLNIFSCRDHTSALETARTSERVLAVFKKQWGNSWGPRVQDLLDNVTFTLVENSGMTMVEIGDLLYDKAFRSRLVANLRNEEVRKYWETVYNGLSDANRSQVTEPLMNKVRAFLRNTLLKNIIGQSENTVNFREKIDQKGIVLVRLNTDMPEASELLGSIITIQMTEAVISRKDIPFTERHPYFMFCDEYQNVSNEMFGKIIAESRKYGLSLFMSHQYRSQLKGEERDFPMACGTFIFLQLTPDDARELAPKINPKNLPKKNVLPLTRPLDALLRSGHENYGLVQLAQKINRLLQAELASRREHLRFIQSTEALVNSPKESYWGYDKERKLLAKIPNIWKNYRPEEYVGRIRDEIEMYLYSRERKQRPSMARLEVLIAEGKEADNALAVCRKDSNLAQRVAVERTHNGKLLGLIAMLGNALEKSPLSTEPEDIDVAGLLRQLPEAHAVAHYKGPHGPEDAMIRIIRPILSGEPLALPPSGRPRHVVEAEIANRHRPAPPEEPTPTNGHRKPARTPVTEVLIPLEVDID